MSNYRIPYQVGDMVGAISELARSKAVVSGTLSYPKVGTIGKVVDVANYGLVRVKWPKDSVDEPRTWWCYDAELRHVRVEEKKRGGKK